MNTLDLSRWLGFGDPSYYWCFYLGEICSAGEADCTDVCADAGIGIQSNLNQDFQCGVGFH